MIFREDQIIDVLMIEDNECDIEIVSDVFERSNYHIALCAVKSAEEGLSFLNKIGKYQEAETPKLILLDLNLPDMNGLEFLDIVSENDQIRMIPTIVMTTSRNHKDIIQSYKKSANCYITKPMDIIEYETAIMDIAYIWFRIAESPVNLEEPE